MNTIDSVSVYKGVAVVAGPRVSFLDHIMPLVHLWDIPLVCTDPWVQICAQVFYPPAEILCATQSTFQNLLSSFSTFITVDPCRLHAHALQFGQFLYRGPGETIAGFHGNPYKFRDLYWIERYGDEDHVLVYGTYLIDYLKEKGVDSRIKKMSYIGNLRKIYYEKHKKFFDDRVSPYLFLNTCRKTILWGPTWSYPNIPEELPLLEQIPDDVQILVKFHPFMFRLFPEKLALWRERYQHSNLIFLDEIPLIYPLLEKSHFYLGDYSSIAYDFLSFDRPLFLLGEADVDWATTLKNPRDVYGAIHKADALSEIRKKTYRYVYELI